MVYGDLPAQLQDSSQQLFQKLFVIALTIVIMELMGLFFLQQSLVI
jgi:hypothetical protein